MPTPPVAPVVPPKARRTTSLWSIIGIVVLIAAVGGLGYMWWNAEQRASSVARDLSVAERRANNIVAPASTEVVFNENVVAWDGKVYTIRQSCDGQMQSNLPEAAGPGIPLSPVSFCIGKNTLTLVKPDGTAAVIETYNAVKAADAPILMGSQLLTFGRGPTKIFISYSTEPCSTDNDCGVGMPTNYVRYYVNLEDLSVHATPNYPLGGKLEWNASGSRAFLIFNLNDCGGAGCGVAPLLGYDLVTDKVSDLTTDKAGPELGALDVEGKKLPYWSDIHWIDDGDIEATIVSPNGMKKVMQFPFSA